jgi:hypothetical protein
MNLFLSDLWADLREKRLWPVAALLLAGLIAVPLVLAKPAEEPRREAPVADSNEAKPSAQVLAAKDNSGEGSALDKFDPKDPFLPPAAILDEGEATSGEGSRSEAGADGGSGSSTTGGSTGSGSDSGAGGSGDTGGSGGGGGGGGGGTSPLGPDTTTQLFTYVVDVTFARNNRRREVNGMRRLEMLPSQSSPLLIFLGADAKAANAVWLVDSTLTARGEGTCKPSPTECAFLYLGAGSEHQFTDEDGDTYILRVDQIRRVPVRSASASSSRRKARKARKSSNSRRFVPPVLTDLVQVASAGEGRSRGARKGR